MKYKSGMSDLSLRKMRMDNVKDRLFQLQYNHFIDHKGCNYHLLVGNCGGKDFYQICHKVVLKQSQSCPNDLSSVVLVVLK